MNIGRMIGTLVVVVTCARGAEAGTLYAQAGDAATGSELLTCTCSNVSTSMRTVLMEGFNAGGSVLGSSSIGLSPLTTAGLAIAGGGATLCKFTVEGSKSSVRCLAVSRESSVATSPDAVVQAQ